MNKAVLAITDHKEISLNKHDVVYNDNETLISEDYELILIDDHFLTDIKFQIPALVIINNIEKIDYILKKNIHNFILYPFTKEELEARIYIAINHFHSEKKNKDKAFLDDLTGLYNKKFLYTKLEELVKEDSPFSTIMIDIDNFSLLNLNCGHIEGDAFIKNLASILKNSIRNTDFAFRFGGEEFVIILQNADSRIAEIVYQRVMNSIQRNNLPFTISGGITSKIYNDTEKTLLERVDKALIEAKKDGKNRFYLI